MINIVRLIKRIKELQAKYKYVRLNIVYVKYHDTFFIYCEHKQRLKSATYIDEFLALEKPTHEEVKTILDSILENTSIEIVKTVNEEGKKEKITSSDEFTF